MKNINFGFLPIHGCVLALYTRYFPEFLGIEVLKFSVKQELKQAGKTLVRIHQCS